MRWEVRVDAGSCNIYVDADTEDEALHRAYLEAYSDMNEHFVPQAVRAKKVEDL